MNLKWDLEPDGIYLDNAATTFMDPEVVDAMMPYLEERYGNPESFHSLGRIVRDEIAEARVNVSRLMGVSASDRIFFTSGGTEANNWAIKGPFLVPDGKVMVSAVEHSSVLEAAGWLERAKYVEGVEIIPVDRDGIIDLGFLESHLAGVRVVSVQWVNNETGVIQPVKEVSDLCKKHGVVFHCDAVQALGKMRLDVEDMGADLVSVSAHKIHGPMGIGALYVKPGVALEPLLHGGQQEGGLRPGTHGVSNIVGFGKACELAWTSIGVDGPHIAGLSKDFVSCFSGSLKARVNGHVTNRIPHIINITVPGVDSSLICGLLDQLYGIAVSKGSACCRGKQSHVLLAMGLSKQECNSSFRLSLSKYTKKGEPQLVCSRIQNAIRESEARSFL